MEANPDYVFVRLGNDRKTSVSLKHLTLLGDNSYTKNVGNLPSSNSSPNETCVVQHVPLADGSETISNSSSENDNVTECQNSVPVESTTDMLLNVGPDEDGSSHGGREIPSTLRRSNRIRKEPSYLKNYSLK